MYKALTRRQLMSETQNLKQMSSQELYELSLDPLDGCYIEAESAIFACLLKWCGDQKALADGRHIHENITIRALDKISPLGNLLVKMYGDCGSLDDAHVSFTNLQKKSRFAWNFIIAAYARNGQSQDALQLFDQMEQDGIMPDKFIFPSVLSACASPAFLAKGKEVHDRIVDFGLESDVVVGTALASMYGKCGSLCNAQLIFDKMPERNIMSWNTMIAAYAQHDFGKAALELFDQMQAEAVTPNHVTFVSILSTYSSQTVLTHVKQFHARVTWSPGWDVVLGTALINLYAKCGSLEHAQMVFDQMPDRNSFSWNAMIAGYAQHGHGKVSLQLFHQMWVAGVLPTKVTCVTILSSCASQESLFKGKQIHAYIYYNGFESDVIIGNALINMYSKCGSLEAAWRAFNNMPERNIVSWTAMISACAHHEESKDAVRLFNQMQEEGIMPNEASFICILSACTDKAALVDGKRVHSCMAGIEYEAEIVTRTALLTMYSKCGSLNDAWCVFQQTPVQNIFAWTAMIVAFVQHGDNRNAFKLFSQMQLEGTIPDRVTLISILSACASQAGLAVAEGKRLHVRITCCGLEADVAMVNALVNMYGKCGSLENALIVFERNPTQDLVSWNGIITIYAQHGQVEDALLLFDRMLKEGNIPDKSTFVSILNACSHTGLLNKACQFFVSMSRDYGIRPIVDHYNCIIDLLGRAGRLDVAEDLIRNMPLKPTMVSWMTLLFACRFQADVERAERAAKQVFQLNPEKIEPYVTLSNIYAAWDTEVQAGDTIHVMSHDVLERQQPCKFIELNWDKHSLLAAFCHDHNNDGAQGKPGIEVSGLDCNY